MKECDEHAFFYKKQEKQGSGSNSPKELNYAQQLNVQEKDSPPESSE